MKRIQIKSLWIFVIAVLVCFTLLGRADKDVYSVHYQQENFIMRYLSESTGDSTQPLSYVGQAEGKLMAYVLDTGALSVRANSYDLGLQYSAEEPGAVLKVFSSDYVCEDGKCGKIFLQQELDPDETYLKVSFEVDQDVHSLYILIETADENFSPESILMESWNPVCTDRYIYCGITLLAAALLFFLCNRKTTSVQPAQLAGLQTTANGTRLAFVFIAASGILVASVPLLREAGVLGHDTVFHLARIEGMASAMQSGQFPVRLHGEVLNGYGYANSYFYPELLLYLPALLRMLGASTLVSYKIYIVFVNLLTVILAYYPFKKFFSSRSVAMGLSLVYLLNPYRLICIYYRGAVGEFTALTFLPLVLYGLYALLLGNQKDWPYLVAGATGLLQSHILTTEFMVFFAAVVVLVFIRRLFTAEKRIFSALRAGIVACLLNGWFIGPMLVMILVLHPAVFTRVQNPTGFASYDMTYLFGITRVAGIGPHPVGWILLFALGAYLVYRMMTPGKTAFIRFADLMAVATVVCIIATTAYFPWETILEIPVLGKLVDAIQFPYRLLSIVAVCGTILLGCAICLWIKDGTKRAAACAVAVGLSIIFAGLFFEVTILGSGIGEYPTKHYYVSNLNNSLSVGQYEYLPSGTDLNEMVDNSPAITSENDTCVISGWKRNGTQMSFEYSMTLTGTEQDLICLPLTDVPDYKILVNGEPVEALISDGRTVSFMPPAESGSVSVRYVEPWIFRAAEIVSLGTLVGCGVIGFRKKKKAG